MQHVESDAVFVPRMTPRGYRVRLATPDDVAALPDVERLAGYLFKTHPDELGIPDGAYDEPNSVETFAVAQQQGRLWVATSDETRAPIGFALVFALDGYAHLEELDVLPAHGRRGVGSALLSAVWDWARALGYPALTLRTFREVPWNAPFYARRGFRVVDSAAVSPGHLRLEASERRRGLRTDNRVSMMSTIDSHHDADAGIDALYEAWSAAFHRRDVPAILALLTADYVLWPPSAAPMTREALEPRLVAALEAYDVTPSFEREERIVSGDLAFECGWDVQRVRPRGGGDEREQRQRVFLVLRRGGDGAWRFARGMSQPGPP